MAGSDLVRAAALWALAVLLVPAASVASATHTPTSASSPPSVPAEPHARASSPPASASSVEARLRAIDAVLRARGVPTEDVHLPNLAAENPGRSGPVTPPTGPGPASIGIADLGLRNVSGSLAPYVYNTSSVFGSVSLTRAESVYVDGDGPDTFGLQLNAVATNVTIAGNSSYEFWAQDFVSYTWTTHSLSFGDNLWNFSAPNASVEPGVLANYGPNGTLVPGVLYYAVGPSFTIAYPFTIGLYLNASEVDGLPSIFFNYTLTNASGTVGAGTFDFVSFNASGAGAPGPFPLPAFQVNGTGVDPIGLPNDFELVAVGSGDGDTTTFFAINATMALKQWDATARAYEVVPAAFDAGGDTGETSNGILPVYRVPTPGGPPRVTLVPGPSFVEGLWNVTGAVDAGSRQFAVTQRPQNAFLFVNPGTSFNASSAEWVPTIRLGASTSDFSIPDTGSFYFRWMLSDHATLNYSASGLLAPLPDSNTSLVENLTATPSVGTDTPLLAWGNAELAAVRQSGNGTIGNPDVLIHEPVDRLDPVFGQLNDLGFPVFAGVLLIDTSAYVNVEDPATAVDYASWAEPLLAELGLPGSNQLQLEFWNVSDVAVANSSDLGGWVSANFLMIPAGEVLFWGSSGNLVYDDTFHDQGVAVALYGGSRNTLWGNTFLPGATGPSLDYGGNVTGILEAESGDLVYNNYVAVPQPAVTLTYDPFSCETVCQAATYVDAWNVSLGPANATARVLGFLLTGSILGTWYQGGNFWSNYGTPSNPFGVLPYNDSGRITVGGDYYPLYPSSVYPVTFAETGLVSPTNWSVSALGVTNVTDGPTIVVSLPNGTYNYSVGSPAGYAGPANGTVVVNGSAVTVGVPFVVLSNETAHAVGLVYGWQWTVWFNLTVSGSSPFGPTGRNATGSGVGGAIAVALENGSYSVAARAYGYRAQAFDPTVTIDGAAAETTVFFSLLVLLAVQSTGLPSGAPWTVTVLSDGFETSETALGDTVVDFTVLQIDPGTYAWDVDAPGYSATPEVGHGYAPVRSTVTVTFSKNGGSSPTIDPLWVAVGALAFLAVVGFALYLREQRRGRRPPAPLTPATPAAAAASGTAAASAGAAAPSPWDEHPGDREQSPPSEPWEEAPGDSERSAPYARKP